MEPVVTFGNGTWIAQSGYGISRSTISKADALAARRRADKAATRRERERATKAQAGRKRGA